MIRVQTTTRGKVHKGTRPANGVLIPSCETSSRRGTKFAQTDSLLTCFRCIYWLVDYSRNPESEYRFIHESLRSEWMQYAVDTKELNELRLELSSKYNREIHLRCNELGKSIDDFYKKRTNGRLGRMK